MVLIPNMGTTPQKGLKLKRLCSIHPFSVSTAAIGEQAAKGQERTFIYRIVPVYRGFSCTDYATADPGSPSADCALRA